MDGLMDVWMDDQVDVSVGGFTDLWMGCWMVF
jgi:hypothetical protein